MNTFTKKAVDVIKNIPIGKVMTYGQISLIAGSPRGARQVVRILHSMSEKHELPWHRVINSKGEIGFKNEEMLFEQRFLLQNEGVKISDKNTISLSAYQYIPMETDEYQGGNKDEFYF